MNNQPRPHRFSHASSIREFTDLPCEAKMATGGAQGDVTLIANYGGKRLSLTVPTNAKVGDVVQKAVETLNLRREDLPLSLLYQGSPMDDQAPLEVALAKMKGVTAIHLVKRTKAGKTTTQRATSITEGVLYAYCITCDGLSKIRPVFRCSSCKKEGLFERTNHEPIDHFDGQYPPDLTVGTCNGCNKQDVQPVISFQCVSCDTGDQAVLRQIRDNIHDIPCMKCSLRQEIVVQMRCSSRHCICLNCFRNMCRVKLDNKSFKNFDGTGYSVPCPGPGDDCKHVPILDPHHFKIVDEEPGNNGSFYKEFKDKSAHNYQPSGDDILCVCKKEIAMSSAHLVPVSEGVKDEPLPTVAGQKWYSSWVSIFKKRAEPAPPPAPRKTRRRASCAGCSTEYCMECKMVWHDGKCPEVDSKALQEQEFPVPADLARSAQWPK